MQSGYGQQQQPPPAAAAPKRYDGKNGQPLYDASHGGHYGASSHIAAQGQAPPPETFSGQWQNVSQGLNGTYRDILNVYWQNQVTKLETEEHDYKLHHLPLARIKKVMKADPEVKMISAEAPILFAKGCDIFITELTMRAWIHAEENKRRTLQRSDIASALAKSDMFDFLIDIVPREDATPQHKRRPEFTPGTYTVPDASASGTAGQEPQQQIGAQPDQFASMEHAQQLQQPYQQQTGMYPPPAPQQQHGQPGQSYGGQPQHPQAQQQQQQQQMFDPSMYANPGAYGMGGMQQMPQHMYAQQPPSQQHQAQQQAQQQQQMAQQYRPPPPPGAGAEHQDPGEEGEGYGGH